MTNNQTDLKFAGAAYVAAVYTKSHALDQHLAQQQRGQESPCRS